MPSPLVTTTQFFEAMYPDGVPAGTSIELRIEETEGNIVQRWAPGITELVQAAKPYNHTARSVWFGPGLRIGNRGDAAGVEWIPALWTDCDAKCYPGNTKEEALNALQTLSLPPSIVVDSGHGMQGYWLLDELVGRDAIPAAVARMRHIQARLSEGLPRRLDSVYDPSRVLRVPNTWNRKDTPLACTVVVFSSTLRYSLDHFEASVEDEMPPPLAYDAKAFSDPVTESHQELMQRARAAGCPGWVFDALTRPDVHGHGDDSDLDFSVMRELTSFLTLAECEHVWLRTFLGSRDKVQRRPDYRMRTITGAAAKHVPAAAGHSNGPAALNAPAPADGSGIAFDDSPDPVGLPPAPPVSSTAARQANYIHRWDTGLELVGRQRNTILANFRPTLSHEIEVVQDGEDSLREYVALLELTPEDTIEIRIGGADLESERALRKRLAPILPASFIVYPHGWQHLAPAMFELATVRGYAKTTTYASMGWVSHEPPVYLLPGSQGIGASGLLPKYQMDDRQLKTLPERMRRYGAGVRPAVTPAELSFAAEGLLTLLQLHPMAVTLAVQVLAGPLSAWGARATPPLVHVLGKTGSFKTTVCLLALNLLGTFDRDSVPETWTSTQNALVRRLWEAKDVTLLVDDYKRSKFGEPVQLIQNYADSTTRSRMSSDQQNRASLTPRGLLLSTGEDTWEEHESTEARTITVYLQRPDDEKLTEFLIQLGSAQRMAAAGALSIFGGTWVQWLAQQGKDHIGARYLDRKIAHTEMISQVHRNVHVRLVGTMASLFAAGDIVQEYLDTTLPAVSEAFGVAKAAAWEQLISTGVDRAEEAATRSPYMWMLSEIQQAFRQHQIHFTHKSSKVWQPYGHAIGESIGFYDEENFYLTRQTTYRWLQKRLAMARSELPFSWNAFCQGAHDTLGAYMHNERDQRNSYVLSVRRQLIRCTVIPRSELGLDEWEPVLEQATDVATQAWDLLE